MSDISEEIEKSVKRIDLGGDNLYIVRQGNNAIMFDTGRSAYRNKVLEIARDEDICMVVLSHGHYNHAANAAAISRDMDIPIAMHAGDYDLLHDNRLQRMHANTFWGYMELFYVHKMRNNVLTDIIDPHIFLQEGDTLERYGIDARVIELPGHTIGSIGLDIWGSELLVSDAVITHRSCGPASIYGNHNIMITSCNKISAIGKRIVYAGHGKPAPNQFWVK